MAGWTCTRTSPDCFRVEFPEVCAGWTGYALLMSDEHFDNAHCDLGLLKYHHDLALELDAPIFKFGDTFCAMQGKWDKRSDTRELRSEFHGGNYLDRLVDEAVKFYTPYASHIALITQGNHESSIEQRHQTDLIERLVSGLRQSGGPTMRGGWTGFVQFSMRTRQGGTPTKRPSYARTLHYHHGYGGGGEVTRGLIDNSRTRSQYLADIYYSGHIHRRNKDENVLVALDSNGTIKYRHQMFLRGASYKDDFAGSWQKSRGQAARPIGGWWLRFRCMARHAGYVVECDAVEANWGKP